MPAAEDERPGRVPGPGAGAADPRERALHSGGAGPRLAIWSTKDPGDAAYTVALEHTRTSVRGEPRTYRLRATQVYRREDGEWRVCHRHGDTVT